ncbi:MAG: hypothetical protein ABTQ26_13190 [Azonexus sp.]
MNSKKKVEAVLLGGALIVTLGGALLPTDASAADICSLSTSGIGETITGSVESFVKVTFTAKCSPNTVVKFSQTTQAFAAQGGSKKGNFRYGSSSEGGGGAKQCATTTEADPSASVKDPAASATDGCA